MGWPKMAHTWGRGLATTTPPGHRATPPLERAAPPRGANPQRPWSFPPRWLLLPPRPDGCGARRSPVPREPSGKNSTPALAERAAAARVPLRPSRLRSAAATGQVSGGPDRPRRFPVGVGAVSGRSRTDHVGLCLPASARAAAGTALPGPPRAGAT